MNLFSGREGGTLSSEAHALLDVWVLPMRNPIAEDRRAAYMRATESIASLCKAGSTPRFSEIAVCYLALFLDRLTTDEKASAVLVADVFEKLIGIESYAPRISVDILGCKEIRSRLFRCALVFLGQGHESDLRIAGTLSFLFALDPVDLFELEASIRLIELNLVAAIHFDWVRMVNSSPEQIASRRPDLMERLW